MSISRKTIAWTLGIVAALYLGLAYALAPWAWRHYEHQRGLADRPMITTTRFEYSRRRAQRRAGRRSGRRDLCDAPARGALA
jgi:hypothetical protein